MKFKSIKNVENFIAAVNQCKGDVWLESVQGDKFNLKSELSRYVAVAALIKDESESLELFVSNAQDEAIMMEFFENNAV